MVRPEQSIQEWNSPKLFLSKIWEHEYYLELGKNGKESEHHLELFYYEKGSTIKLVLKSDETFMHAYSGYFNELDGQYNTQLTLPEHGFLEHEMNGWIFPLEKSDELNELLTKLNSDRFETKTCDYKPYFEVERTGKSTWKDMIACLDYVDKLSIEEIYNSEGSKGMMISGSPKDVDALKVNHGKEVVCLMTGTKKISVCVQKLFSDDVGESSPHHNGDEDRAD